MRINLIGGHEISWFDDIEFEFVDFKLYVIYYSEQLFCWDLKFVDCPTQETHKLNVRLN